MNQIGKAFPEFISGVTSSGDVILDLSNKEQILANLRRKTALATLEAAKAEGKEADEE